MTERKKLIITIQNRIDEARNKGLKTTTIFISTLSTCMALLKEQEYKDRMFHALEDDWKAMLKEQEWNILTEDADGIVHGLPGDDGTYLMTDGKDIWIDDYVDGVDDGVFLDSGRDIREIKAWMYMPKLPKEGR